MSRASLRRADGTGVANATPVPARPEDAATPEDAHRLALILALELRLEGVSPGVLVELLGFSHRRAVALLDGHPAAIPVDELGRLAALAHLDLDALFRAALVPP